jgi:precorrin-2 dehydrogenase/sirohydrochlorin ferrochelatase
VTYRYPVLLDTTDSLAVIVGGGAVGVRKAAGLIDAGTRQVRVVSPTFHHDMPADVERVTATYKPAHLKGAQLAFAATDSSAVNDAVVRDARRLGIWVNRADADTAHPGNFTLPAQLRDGPVLVTVSTTGSPALAATIRDSIRLDPRFAKLATALQSLRPRIRASLDPARRRTLFQELASQEALAIIATGDETSLWQWAATRYPELLNK